MEFNWQFTPFAFIYLATGLIVLRISHQAWNRRRAPGAKPLSLLMIAIAIWAIGDGFGQLTADLDLKILIAKFTYLGIVATPVLYFMAMAAISQLDVSLDWRVLGLLAVVPMFALFLAFTNELHGLIWSKIVLIDSPFGELASYEHGAGFWLLLVYSYVLIFLGTAFLVRAAIVRVHWYRVQALALLLAALLPWAANWSYVSGIGPGSGFDPTVVAFALTGALVAWSLSRLDLFKVLPVARTTLVEALTDGVLVLDRSGLIVDINESAFRLLETDRTVVGKSLAAVSRLGQQLLDCLAVDGSPIAEIALSGDQPRYIEVQINSLRGGRTEFLGHLLVLHDVTDRKNLENELRTALSNLSQRQQLLHILSETQKAILSSVNAAILTVATDGTILSCNVASERLFGFSTSTLTGSMSFDELFDQNGNWLHIQDDDLEELVVTQGISSLMNHILNLQGSDGPLVAEAVFRRQNEETFAGLLSVTAAPGDDLNIPHRFVVLINDISVQKQVENNLILSEDQLRRANQELARALRQKDNFLAIISHELRTPLTAILGMCELLDDQVAGELNERQQRYVHMIRSSGYHLLDIINEILELQKMEQGNPEFKMDLVEIESFCANSLDLLRERAAQKQQEMVLAVERDVPAKMTVDENRLRKLLGKLLNNASKFTPSGGQLGLTVRPGKRAGTVDFSVWDTGIGIPADEMPHLFQPFVQLDDGLTRQHEGLGLGLILVYHTVRLLGGSIHVESTLGEGSRFTVALPHSPLIPTAVETTEDAPMRNKQRDGDILVVDQGLAECDWIVETLEIAGHAVHRVETLGDLAMFSQTLNAQVVLLDIPVYAEQRSADLQRLRSLRSANPLRIVGLLSVVIPGAAQRCIDEGLDSVLVRPLAADTLLDAVFPIRAAIEPGNVLSQTQSDS